MEVTYVDKKDYFRMMDEKEEEYSKYPQLARYKEYISKAFQKQRDYIEQGIVQPYIQEENGIKCVKLEIKENLDEQTLQQIKKEANFIVKVETVIGHSILKNE